MTNADRLRSLFLPVAALALACGNLGGSRAKIRCNGQGDCDPGYGCNENVCQRWVDVPGVVSTEPFTGTGSFLVNLGAPGSYQVLAQYDADTSGIPISAFFGRDDASRQSEQGTGKVYSSGAFDNAPGAYVLRIDAGLGVTIRQISVSPCSGDYSEGINNCGACGHVCATPPGLRYPPVCVAGTCRWSGDIQAFVDFVNVRPAPDTNEAPLQQVNRGERLFFDCQAVGELISQAGTSKTSNVWDHLPAYDGYVADLLVDTGVDAMVAPACP